MSGLRISKEDLERARRVAPEWARVENESALMLFPEA